MFYAYIVIRRKIHTCSFKYYFKTIILEKSYGGSNKRIIIIFQKQPIIARNAYLFQYITLII